MKKLLWLAPLIFAGCVSTANPALDAPRSMIFSDSHALSKTEYNRTKGLVEERRAAREMGCANEPGN